jgi:hypothetical protein
LLSQPSLGTLNENGTPATVSDFLSGRDGSMSSTPAGVGEGEMTGVGETGLGKPSLA